MSRRESGAAAAAVLVYGKRAQSRRRNGRSLAAPRETRVDVRRQFRAGQAHYLPPLSSRALRGVPLVSRPHLRWWWCGGSVCPRMSACMSVKSVWCVCVCVCDIAACWCLPACSASQQWSRRPSPPKETCQSASLITAGRVDPSSIRRSRSETLSSRPRRRRHQTAKS